MKLLVELTNLKESPNSDLENPADRLTDDIRDNWMGMGEDEVLELVKQRVADGGLTYLKGLSEDDLEEVVSDAWYQAQNQFG